MHPDDVDIDTAPVGRLIAAQLPQWAGLPVVKVPSAGTDNAMYRLGADMVVRLPRRRTPNDVPGTRRPPARRLIGDGWSATQCMVSGRTSPS
jgi:aminoglycoside phosphotransferase (APT) family kinase protein